MLTHSKLAVILHADVVASTALVQKDERVAHDRIRDAFRTFSEVITCHGGTAHEVRGDALVAEFSKASDSVSAAVAFQAAHMEHLRGVADEIRPEVRVGIAMGEVVIADGTITGEGVVLAQRLEQIANPGGVCIQGAAYETIPKRLPFRFESLGERQLKGFDEPVRAFAVHAETADAPPTLFPASRVATPKPPDRPSIAVLPFINMSGDPDQEFFADGMTEDIITGLIRFPSVFVIARNSTFVYKSQVVDVTQVAQELGVQYVLEGSVRKGGDRLRITAQLVDVERRNNLWAERYDRGLEDLFAVQDDVTEAIVSAIAPEIGDAERKRALRAPPRNLDAWGLYQHGLAAYYVPTIPSLTSAIQLFDKACTLDPSFAHAFAMSAQAWLRLMRQSPLDDRAGRLAQARKQARKAVALEPRDPICLAAHGRVLAVSGQREAAISTLQEAVALNPNYADAQARLAATLAEAGRSNDAVAHFDLALRLSPHDPYSASFRQMRAGALLDLGQYDASAQTAYLATESPNPPIWAYVVLAAALTKLGCEDESKAALAEVFRSTPDFSLEHARQYLKHYAPEISRCRIELFRDAGVPERLEV